MRFAQRHPYLFWQLIGWGLMAADFVFLVISVLNDFGEWCYPIIVFTFIGALFAVTVSPVIIRFTRRREVPHNSDDLLEKVIRTKIAELRTARYGIGRDAVAAILAFLSILVFIFAAYFLGEHVHLALGFASMVLALIAPFSGFQRAAFCTKRIMRTLWQGAGDSTGGEMSRSDRGVDRQTGDPQFSPPLSPRE